MDKEDISGMRPKLGDTSITLPLTFDYSGGRKDKNKSAKLWSVILGVVGIIIFIGTLTGKGNFIEKIIISFLIVVIFSFVIRFVLLKEGKKKEDFKALMATDYKLDYRDIWGIYKIEDMYPYICRFRNGKSGVYIRLNKDVILGKYADSEYQHYEAVADAYNLAGAGRVQMIHIDYMDNVGTDDRLEDSFIALEDVSNPDIKDLLTDIYSYQQNNLYGRVTTFDVYAFLWTGNDVTAWNSISRILNCFLDANYRSYHVLDDKELRELTKVIFNLNDFSVSDASSYAFSNVSTSSSIVPISITDVDGTVTKLNKTLEERIAERKAKEDEEIANKREAKRRKKSKRKKLSKNNKNDDIFNDMFN